MELSTILSVAASSSPARSAPLAESGDIALHPLLLQSLHWMSKAKKARENQHGLGKTIVDNERNKHILVAKKVIC